MAEVIVHPDVILTATEIDILKKAYNIICEIRNDAEEQSGKIFHDFSELESNFFITFNRWGYQFKEWD